MSRVSLAIALVSAVQIVLDSSQMSNMIMMVNAQHRAPQGFIFDCDNGVCPDGPYQDKCAQCGVLSYRDGATCTQCLCFNSEKELQWVSTMRSSHKCAEIDADKDGDLICNLYSLRGGKKGKKGKSKTVTQNPTMEDITTKAPTVGKNLVKVDFKFHCADDDQSGDKECPTGPYQSFCPRCDVNTDSTPPNDPRPSISCQCFNGNGQMLLGTSTMWNYQLCPKIVTSFGGQLGCVGAGKAQGITVYGGRRALGSRAVDGDAGVDVDADAGGDGDANDGVEEEGIEISVSEMVQQEEDAEIREEDALIIN